MEKISENAKKIIADIAENQEMKEIYVNYISLSNETEKTIFWQKLSEQINTKTPLEQQIFHKNLQKGLLAISTRIGALAGNMLEIVPK